ncbi:N'-adenosyl(rRNA) dimethyltransferase), partial [Durusdinium trenchii]
GFAARHGWWLVAATWLVDVTLEASVPKLPARSHRPKQQLGQSYLSDPNTVAKIVRSFEKAVHERGGSSTSAVLELGPGLGALTQLLVSSFPRMVAVEVDPRAVEILRKDLPKLEVRLQNMLKLNYSELLLEMGGPCFVVGNLPYSITTEALLSLVLSPRSIRFAQVMVQKEAAERMVAPVGSKDYSVLSVMLQAFARLRQLYLVPPTAFYPQPKVVSAVVELDFDHPTTEVDVGVLLDVVKESFRQRKRALRHSLKGYLQKRRLLLPLSWAKLRAEQLSPSDFIELTKQVCR